MRYYYFALLYQKYWWYGLQFLRYRVWQTEISNYGSFLPSPPPPPLLKNLKNLNFEKMKTISGDIIILHMCTKNHNHMRYSSWDTVWHRHNFLSFGAIFCPFTPLTTHKIKILKKWEKHLEISSFYTYVPKIMNI